MGLQVRPSSPLRRLVAIASASTLAVAVAGCAHPPSGVIVPAPGTASEPIAPTPAGAPFADHGVLIHRRQGVVGSRESFAVRALEGSYEVDSEQRIEGAGDEGVDRGVLRVGIDLRPIRDRS